MTLLFHQYSKGAGSGEETLVTSETEAPSTLTKDQGEPRLGENTAESNTELSETIKHIKYTDASEKDIDESLAYVKDTVDTENDTAGSLAPARDSRSSTALQKYLADNDLLSREGSVDVDSLVHAQLESEVEHSPDEKSWDEELREALKQDSELADIYEGGLDNNQSADASGNSADIIVGVNSECESVNKDQEITTVEINVQATDNDISGSNIDLDALDEGLIMPETRDSMDGAVSPSLMFASCRYRWEKAIVTQSQNIVFVTINKKEIEPIKLGWSDSSKCYYSDEFKIPVGTYVGNLVIDGTFYPVEDITIKHYTFEVDLYLKDEIIQDEQENTNSITKSENSVQESPVKNGAEQQSTGAQKKADSFDYTANRDYSYRYSPTRARMESDKESVKSEGSGINLSSKYQDLVRSQMSNKNSFLDQDSDNEVGFSAKLDHLDLDDGRRTPVGEDGTKQYQDGDAKDLGGLDMGYSLRSVDDHTGDKDTDLESAVLNRLSTLDRRTPSSVVDDVLGQGHARTPIYSTETPVHSRNNSAHSSARQTPLSDTREFVRPESVNSVTSANSLSRHLIDDMLDDALGRNAVSPKVEGQQEIKQGSVNGSLPKTPPPEQIDDVLNPSDRHSPIRRDYLNGSPRVSNHSTQHSAQNSAPGSANNSQRQTPQKEMISDFLQTSQEKLYSSQNIRKLSYSDHGSPHGSHHSSQHSSQHGSNHSSHHSSHHSGSSSAASSRPQSLTSEQELTQYYENGTESPKVPLPNETSNAQRTSSASSLPVIGNQRYTPEKRSMTPDNHIRIPGAGSILKGPLLPGRQTPRTPLSNASSRTVTPVNAPDYGQDAKTQENVKDLENTVSSLRRLLASREQEVVEVRGQLEEVRGQNQKFQGDLDKLRARASPGPQIAELERKYNEAVQENDRLSNQIVLMREELRAKEHPSLNSYDPVNSPAAKQRKIDDLTSQIQDLQEAHESSIAELTAAENKVKQLAEENERLRIAQNSAIRDVEDDNRLLKSEVSRLKESRPTFTEATEHRFKIELQQVKDDNRSLRERNYQLHDDNLKLREEITNLRKSFDLMDSVNKTYKEDRKAKPVDEYIREDRTKRLESSYQGDSRGKHGYRTSDPLSSYQRSDPLPVDENSNTYSSYSKTETRSQYDAGILKTDRTIDLDSDLIRRSNTDHLARSDGGRYQKSGSYGNVEIDRLAQSESMRYNSDYRSMPDGGVGDRLRPAPPKYESRPKTPERPSALSSSKKDISHSSQLDRMKYDRLDHGEFDYVRKDRSRTSSAEVDYRSMPAYSSELSKTMPSLTGRSKEIYEEITDKRLKERGQSVSPADGGPAQPSKRELDEVTDDPSKPEQPSANIPATSAQVFVNRYIPQNSKDPTPPSTEESKLLSLERVDVSYTRPSQTHTRHIDRDEKDYEVRDSLYQDDGDMSDTATDILVNAQPLDKLPATWNKSRMRRGSIGSDGSDFSDIDEQLTTSLRKRSKSADGREVLRRMAPTGSSNTRGRQTTPGKGDRPLSRTLSPGASSAGFRSVTPRPLATQHNKTTLSIASSLNSLTQGLRPFAPRSPQDLQVNDVIKFSRQGGKLSQGTIKFIGHLPGRGDIYLGVELDKEDGKHDGTFEGVRYFKCKPSKGVFVAYNKVVMAWTSY